MSETIKETNFDTLKLKARGKVRDIYEIDEYLLIVVTDRVSAFDVVMDDPIPDKGKVLTQISNFWFDKMKDIIPNHLVTCNVDEFPKECKSYRDILEKRSMLVKKAEPLPVECVVRGYISGSAWKEYKKNKMISGIRLPDGLVESQKLEPPIFTPATKAPKGEHDENISFEKMKEIVGDVAEIIRDISIKIYERAKDIAFEKGIIIADTKFEFGYINGKLHLIDELLTPDSSRFWPVDSYAPGGTQKSFDKQFLRDYLLSLNWNFSPPPPKLPLEIIEKTSEKYKEALFRLTGITL